MPGWSEALIQVVSDPPLARRLGDAARARVEEEFALTKVVERYVALYRDLLARRFPAGD